MKLVYQNICLLALAASLSACGNSSSSIGNESATEVALSSASGAESSSDGSQGAMSALDIYEKPSLMKSLGSFINQIIPQAFANTSPACETLATGLTTTGCTNNAIDLAYGTGCNFVKAHGGSFAAVWTGGFTFAFNPTCPANVGALKGSGKVMVRTADANTTRSLSGLQVSVITNAASGYTAPQNPGGGVTTTFNVDNSHNITMHGNHYLATLNGKTVWDHTVYTTNDIKVTPNADGTKTVSQGTIVLLHNLAKYTATVVINSLTYNTATCGCFPTAGSVTTTFSGTRTGTETVTFTGCGTTSGFTMNHCL